MPMVGSEFVCEAVPPFLRCTYHTSVRRNGVRGVTLDRNQSKKPTAYLDPKRTENDGMFRLFLEASGSHCTYFWGPARFALFTARVSVLTIQGFGQGVQALELYTYVPHVMAF